jgi:hypothetical protein
MQRDHRSCLAGFSWALKSMPYPAPALAAKAKTAVWREFRAAHYSVI